MNRILKTHRALKVESAATARRKARGFTLVELLVVISIIAILVALFIPILSKVKERAKVAQCTANIKEMANALGIYVSEHDGNVFTYQPDYLWMDLLEPYHANLSSVRYCPNAFFQSKDGWGEAKLSWFRNRSHGSYGMNGWFYSIHNAYNGGSGHFGGVGYPRNFWKNMDHATSETPLFMDCAWVDGWPDENDVIPPSTEKSAPHQQLGHYMQRFFINRHPVDRVVSAFADGHVEVVPLSMLWNLRWHANFEPQGEVRYNRSERGAPLDPSDSSGSTK